MASTLPAELDNDLSKCVDPLIIEESLEVKLPTIWTDGKAMKSRGGNSERREKNKKDDQRRERVRRKKMQVREKVGKTRNIVFFPMFCGPGGSKSGLAKVAGAEPFCRMRDKQLHGAVARSIFRSQHVKNTSASEPFWKLRCRKSACRCGAKMREANFEVKMCKA